MFRFFRQIRQNLVSEQKMSKPASPAGRYVLYALGEIFLVVIGILIALQLNIMYEQTKEKKATRELLTGMQADLQLEAERIAYLKDYYSAITDGIQKMIRHQQGQETYSNDELGQYFLATMEFRKFSKFNINYQTLYGSGLLQEIEDQELSEHIIRYYTVQFLEWSLEIYQQKAVSFNFSQAPYFDPLDKLQARTNHEHIPDFNLAINKGFKTDFGAFINKAEVLNFLVDLLHQSGLVFSNLNNYNETNEELSRRIQTYLEP
jgi:RNA polymerase-interacting CarD/CdnL/TRCF family regulator